MSDKVLGLAQLSDDAIVKIISQSVTAHDPLPDTIRTTVNGRRVIRSYLAFDPWPPTDFFAAAPDVRGRHLDEPTPGAFPIVDRDGTFGIATTSKSAVLWWAPPADVIDIAACASEVFDSYAAWRAGELCGVVRETFLINGDDFVLLDVSAEWLHVSPKVALATLDQRDAATKRTPEPEPAICLLSP